MTSNKMLKICNMIYIQEYILVLECVIYIYVCSTVQSCVHTCGHKEKIVKISYKKQVASISVIVNDAVLNLETMVMSMGLCGTALLVCTAVAAS